MTWDGTLACSDDTCSVLATHIVWSDRTRPSVWCEACAREFQRGTLGPRWHVEPLPDLAALRRDAAALARVREVLTECHRNSHCATTLMRIANAVEWEPPNA